MRTSLSKTELTAAAHVLIENLIDPLGRPPFRAALNQLATYAPDSDREQLAHLHLQGND